MLIVGADVTTFSHVEEPHLKKSVPSLSHHLDILFGPGRTISFSDEIKDGLFRVVDEKISVDGHFVGHSHKTHLLCFFGTGRHLGHGDCLESLPNKWK